MKFNEGVIIYTKFKYVNIFLGIRGVSPTPVGGEQENTSSPGLEEMWSRTVTPEDVEQLQEMRVIMERQLMATPKKKPPRKERKHTPSKKKEQPSKSSGTSNKRSRSPSTSSSSETDTQVSIADSSEDSQGSSTGYTDSDSQSEGESDGSEDHQVNAEGELETDISHSKYSLKSFGLSCCS